MLSCQPDSAIDDCTDRHSVSLGRTGLTRNTITCYKKPMNPTYPFDRPVIILAAPRSGSTLLFETLALSPDLWTIGGESHGIFERIKRYNPNTEYCDSNALYAEDSIPEVIDLIRQLFFQKLRDARGRSVQSMNRGQLRPLRMLEKTPKNSLRVSLLNRIFPDALFIYLVRNPRDNISSIIDAWNSGRFVTYPNLDGRQKPWSLLLPPGWQSYHEAPVEEIAAFQWRSANEAILQELGKLDRNRWTAVSYGQQLNAGENTLARLCEFCDISADGVVDSSAGGQSSHSRYTLSPPSPDKWQRHATALARVLPGLADTIELIKKFATDIPREEFDLSIEGAAD